MERKLFWLDQNRAQPRAKASLQATKTLERELEWVRMAPKKDQTKQKHVCLIIKLMSQDQAKYRKSEIFIPNGPRLEQCH